MEQFRAAYKKLNAEQRKAVDTIDGPVLVIAGPGTGKTQLLTTRIANILAKTDTPPENILCLTFTDAAAATMRERLNGMIGQAAYNVTISTYHAFGSELLRRYNDYFPEAAELQPADELLLDQVLRDVQGALPYSNPLKSAVFLRDIKTLVGDFKRALLSPSDVRKVAADNERFITAATEAAKDCLRGVARMDKKAVPLFENLLTKTPRMPKTELPAGTLGLSRLWTEELSDALQAVEASGKTTELTAWKNRWLVKDAAGEFVASGTETGRKLNAAADIYEDYLAALTARGLYDYDDMILQAIHGLESNVDLRYTLQEKYQYLLLDEFQDTNGAQLKLVELLTDNPVHEGRPNVLAVGDDDQAIYAFQGANYSHMLQFYNRYKDVLVVPLTENYRSRPEILELAAAVGEQIGERLHHNFTAIDKTLTAANNSLAPAQLGRYEFRGDLSQNAWVAKQAKALIGQGIRASEIAVLAPKHRHLEAVLPFLRQKKVPIRYEKRENVLEDPAIEQVLAMSRLVLALAEADYATANYWWPQVLSYPFWELSTSKIWELSWKARSDGNWTEILCEHQETRLIALFFMRLALQALSEPLEVSLDYLLGVTPLQLNEKDSAEYRSPYYHHYFGEATNDVADGAGFWQLLSNLTVLRQHLRGYRGEDDRLPTLRDLMVFVSAHQAADIKILNTNPYQEADDAVQLMTAYKSKGQEFQAVFLLNLDDETWGSRARTQSSRISLPENLKFIRYAGASEDERLRLLYVALTRAKTQLYLVNFATGFNGKALSRLKYLKEEVQSDGSIISPLLPEHARTVHQLDVKPPELEDLGVYWHQRHLESAAEPSLQVLLQDRLRKYQLSASGLNRFTDTSRDGPRSFLLRDLLGFPSGSSTSGMYGDTIHETLHWLYCQLKQTGSLPSFKQTFTTFEKKLRLRHLAERDFTQLLERGRTCLSAYLEQRSTTIHAGDYSEYSFRSEGVFIGSAHLGGKVDRLRVDRANKTITIVDFKTGSSANRWTSDIKLYNYRKQLYFYKLLVERSATFKGYKVIDSYLEFVEPDENGAINELHLKFDDDVQHDFEKLIAATWQHIMALRFPDVSSYGEDSKAVAAFEQDLISGKL